MSGNDRLPYGFPQPKPKKNFSGDDDEGPSRKIAGGAGISFSPMGMAPMGSSFTPVTSPIDFASYSTQSQKVGSSQGPGLAKPQYKPPAHLFRWQLADVPTLPEFHPLERTATFCEHTSASEVSSRVSNVLRKRSVEAVYDDEKAKVRCLSASGVDFRVRLYRGRGEYNHGIIVEVQRRFGYALDFHEITEAILNGAMGLPTEATPMVASNTLPLVSDTEDEYVPPPSSGASSLKMISKMFSANGYDSYHLALQTLESLTDASRMGAATALSVSQELLNPDNDVGSKVVELIVKKDEDMFNLQVMALKIVANALTALKGQIPDMLRELLRPVLLKELQKAGSSNLLAAEQAARCFQYLFQGDHDIGEIKDALETAKAVGQARHAGLERQTKATLSKMM